MFTGIVRKYAERIHQLPGPKEPVYKIFGLKGYLIIAFMITLGITFKHIPGIPEPFFAWFYLGLGLGLISAGIRFLILWWKEKDTWYWQGRIILNRQIQASLGRGR